MINFLIGFSILFSASKLSKGSVLLIERRDGSGKLSRLIMEVPKEYNI